LIWKQRGAGHPYRLTIVGCIRLRTIRSDTLRYSVPLTVPLTPCKPIFTRKADGITAGSPEAKRESLSVRPSYSHEDVHQIVEAIALYEYLAVNLLLDDSVSESPNYCVWRSGHSARYSEFGAKFAELAEASALRPGRDAIESKIVRNSCALIVSPLHSKQYQIFCSNISGSR
jgi:hypothetical protein